MTLGRWPIHPRPYAGEALSSWVSRLAQALGASSASDLLQYEFGVPLGKRRGYEWLDFDPPPLLIDGLAARTGEDLGAVRAMTARGYVPLLIDSLSPGAFDEYVGQYHLLLPAGCRKPRGSPVIPWYDPERFAAPRGCERCLKEDVSPYLRLSWRMPWMATCPVHQAVLEPVLHIGESCKVVSQSDSHKGTEPIRVRLLPEQVAVDSMTRQAVTAGFCEGPHGRLHGGVWIRLLRSVIQEVTIAPTRARGSRLRIALYWQDLGLEYRTPLHPPFEKLSVAMQVTILNVAAVAIIHESWQKLGFPFSTVQRTLRWAARPSDIDELMERCVAEVGVNSALVDVFRRMIAAMDRPYQQATGSINFMPETL